MRAIIQTDVGGPEVLQYSDSVPDPKKPGQGDVIIDVYAAALNGPDLLQRQGKYPPPPGTTDILGLDVSGKIAEVGSGVDQWKVGDEVMALVNGGGYAEKVLALAGYVMRKPANLSWVEAASIPEVFLTAYLELVIVGKMKKGESILVHAGASGVGTAGIQIAREIGASKIFTTAGSQAKVDAAKKLGADIGINYKEEDFLEVIQRELKGKPGVESVPGGARGGAGVDIILDIVGAVHYPKNLDALAIDGRCLVVSYVSGSKATIELDKVLAKRLKIIGSTLRARPRQQKEEIVKQFSEWALPLFEQGKLKPLVDKVFPMEKARDAHEYMESKKNIGKIVLVVREEAEE